LKEKDPEQLRAAVELPDIITEAELYIIIESFGRVVDTVQQICIQETVGVNILFEINCKYTTQKLYILFSSFIGNNTKTKYRRYWEQLLYYIYCCSGESGAIQQVV
jgi:hypothetical protein